MKPNPNSEFKLDDEDHQEIYSSQILPQLSKAESVDKPKAVLVAGQPGAGKSAITAQAKSELANHGDSVVIDIDKLRERHPKYESYQAENNREAAGMVQPDAGKWGRQLIQDAMKEKKNIVVDGTLMLPDVAKKLCKQFKKAGYEIDVRAMAVSAEDSEVAAYKRYEERKAVEQPGRWVPKEIREKAYTGMLESVDLINKEKLADHISIHARSLAVNGKTRIIYSEKAGTGDPINAITSERNRPRAPEEQQKFNNDIKQLMQQIKRRDPNFSEPDNKFFLNNFQTQLPNNQRSIQNKSSPKLAPENTNNTSGAQPKMDIKAALAMGKQAVAENGSVINKEINKIQDEKALRQEHKQEHVKKPSKDPEIEH